jgi:hypothetical protein
MTPTYQGPKKPPRLAELIRATPVASGLTRLDEEEPKQSKPAAIKPERAIRFERLGHEQRMDKDRSPTLLDAKRAYSAVSSAFRDTANLARLPRRNTMTEGLSSHEA